MKTKLDLLNDEKTDLTTRITQLEEQQKSLRSQMEADPKRRAAILAPQYGNLGTQLEVFAVKLIDVQKQIEAEQARLSSPEVKKAIAKAEKIISDGQKTRDEVVADVKKLLARVDTAIGAGHEAASLLRIAERDPLPYSPLYAELAQLQQVLGGYVQLRADQESHAAAFKRIAADNLAKAQAKEQEETKAKAAAEARRKEDKKRAEKHNKAQANAWGLLGK